MNDTPKSSDDWLLPPDPQEPAAGQTPAAEQPSPRRNLVRAAVLVVAGLIVGGGAVATVQAVADDGDGRPSLAGSDDGPGRGGFPPGGPGGVPGELHLQGTLTAVTSDSVTVRTASGSDTYQIVDGTQIVRDGALAGADDLEVDDAVLVHVIPSSSGDLVVERIFAGTLPPGVPGTSGDDDNGGATDDDSSDEGTSAT